MRRSWPRPVRDWRTCQEGEQGHSQGCRSLRGRSGRNISNPGREQLAEPDKPRPETLNMPQQANPLPSMVAKPSLPLLPAKAIQASPTTANRRRNTATPSASSRGKCRKANNVSGPTRLCLFLECGDFPPLLFFRFSRKNKQNKAAGKRTPKKANRTSRLTWNNGLIGSSIRFAQTGDFHLNRQRNRSILNNNTCSNALRYGGQVSPVSGRRSRKIAGDGERTVPRPFFWSLNLEC